MKVTSAVTAEIKGILACELDSPLSVAHDDFGDYMGPTI